MSDPKNQADQDQRERDKLSGDKGGDGQPIAGGLTDEERGDQGADGDGADSDGDE